MGFINESLRVLWSLPANTHATHGVKRRQLPRIKVSYPIWLNGSGIFIAETPKALSEISDPVSAQQHFMLQRARD